MERAPLRPVPSRPAGPVDPAEATTHVAAALPALGASEARALALVALAGKSRPEAAEDVGLERDQLARALARARKELRRAMFPLPGSGWCERAERLVSDRLDGDLQPPGTARLEVHLRNCPRCVEHERRLAQATDALVASFVAAHPAARGDGEQPAAPEAPPATGPPLSVVVPHRPLPAARPFGVAVAPAPAREHVVEPEPAAHPEPAHEPAQPEPAPDQTEQVPQPVVEPAAPERPAEPATPERPAAAAAARPAAQTSRPEAPGSEPQPLIWRVLLALAVALAAVTAVVAAIGIANAL